MTKEGWQPAAIGCVEHVPWNLWPPRAVMVGLLVLLVLLGRVVTLLVMTRLHVVLVLVLVQVMTLLTTGGRQSVRRPVHLKGRPRTPDEGAHPATPP